MLAAVSLVFLVPLIGLSIDVGFLYVAKSKLQAAVDGAALAAARSLSTGSSTQAQTTSAQNNAVNWFYANFPSNFFGTTNTNMTTDSVTVSDDANNAHLRDVSVTASTSVNTFFMRWLSFGNITVSATGTASRRDVVAMLVLDRSFSIQLAGACGTMKAAAKAFTGQFAEGRDNIGLVTFANDVWMEASPSTSFQSTLGYTNDQGSGTGLIDNINCQGNTNTSSAISVAYNELWKMNEPGALNVIVLETDGLPNTMTLNFWDSSNSVVGLTSSSTCKDNSGNYLRNDTSSSSFSNIQWTNSIPLGTSSYLSGNPTSTPGAGNLVGAIGVPDPGDATCCGSPLDFIYMQQPYNGSMMPAAPGGGTSISDFESTWATNTNTTARNCGFTGSATASAPGSGNFVATMSDIAWFPKTDVFGNALNPASHPYQSVCATADGKHIMNGSCTNGNTAYTNFHNAAENAADNAAYNARNGSDLPSPNNTTTMQAMIFVIGLGGTEGSPPDPILMQRIANDPNGDTFNVPAKYSACASETGCYTYSSQPQGTFIYSSTPSTWAEGFTLISSQILRLAK